MASFLDNMRGKSAEDPAPQADSDFAEFGDAPPLADSPPPPGGASLGDSARQTAAGKPFTKWYNVHERHSLGEFRAEGYILGIIAVLVIFHLIGSRRNKSKARAWARSHAPLLRAEFSSVGFDGVPAGPNTEADDGASIIKEKSLFQFEAYATGRVNVAFVDVNIGLTKRFNPIMSAVESVFGAFLDTVESPRDIASATLYPFDGREAKIVPSVPGGEVKAPKSTYDGFVWAVVHKEKMQRLRDDRYDVSLTSTKDNAKLPSWLAVMSESAEITNTFLTSELVDAVTKAGDLFEYLIITDQSLDKPMTIDETKPKKRVHLRHGLPSNDDYTDILPLFSHFLGLPDFLVKNAHFRPEIQATLRKTRQRAITELERAKQAEEAEERKAQQEREKKEKRDAKLKLMDAKSQKKFLEKEREKELKKGQRKGTVRA